MTFGGLSAAADAPALRMLLTPARIKALRFIFDPSIAGGVQIHRTASVGRVQIAHSERPVFGCRRFDRPHCVSTFVHFIRYCLIPAYPAGVEMVIPVRKPL